MSAIASPERLLAAGKWQVDPECSVLEFRVRQLLMESVKGRFLDFDGAIWPDETPYVVGSIQAASLDTNHRERDAHLRSPDFFDVERYPEILFSSKRVALGHDGSLMVAGDLTIKQITRPLELKGTLRGAVIGLDGRERIACELRGELNPLEYQLSRTRGLEPGGTRVGPIVELSLHVSLVRDVPLEWAA
jgi:polyisoprenoid-binding protein YceI